MIENELVNNYEIKKSFIDFSNSKLKNNFIKNYKIKFRGTNWDEKGIKGFLSKDNILRLRENANNDSIIYTSKGNSIERATVKQGMEYRPDKVAAYYLGDERLGWLIDITNGFYNGIKDYYLGREILLPPKDYLERLRKE